MCHVSILLFLSCLPVCPFLTKLINLALVILTSKGFEMSIYIPSNVWHNLFYMTWIFPYMITEAIHLLDNALIVISRNDSPWSRLGCLHGTTPPPHPISPLVKQLCTIRNRNTKKYGDVNADVSKGKWANPQQPSMQHGTGSKGWWNTVNISSVINSEDINLFFQMNWMAEPFENCFQWRSYCNWSLLSRPASRLYNLRVCRYYAWVR